MIVEDMVPVLSLLDFIVLECRVIDSLPLCCIFDGAASCLP